VADAAAGGEGALRALAEELGVLPRGAAVSLFERQLERFRRSWRALHAYRAASYPGNALCIRAATSPVTDPWEGLVLGGVRAHRLAGDHFALLRAPLVSEVATLVDGALSR